MRSTELEQLKPFLLKFYKGIGTPVALSNYMLAAAGEWNALLSRRIAPGHYVSAEEYFWDNAACELLRKIQLQDTQSTEARFQAAVARFRASEARCHATNINLDRFIHNYGLTVQDIPVADFIDQWRKIVRRVLGKLPSALEPCFSKGSTLSDKGVRVTIPDKMSSRPTLYQGMSDIWAHSIKHTIYDRPCHWQKPKVVGGNLFFTQPKNWDVDRGCCIEASAAVSLQLYVGRVLKSRYRRYYKVDLRHSKPLHMQRAMAASVDGGEATIDLSNASDTIAKALVRLLLPPDWYALLNSLRATHTSVRGQQWFLAKFSSMGNGFTFELETILFRTLVEAICGYDESLVFGDDIIVKTEHAAAVVACLRYFGFETNTEKTYVSGPFRESCGGDYFDGKPVRAHYLKKVPDEPQHWISLANGIRRLDPDLRRLHRAWWYCYQQVPMNWRNMGPEWGGDLWFFDPQAEPADHSYNGLVVPSFRGMRPVSVNIHVGRFKPLVSIIAAAYTGRARLALRNRISGYKPVYIPMYGLPDDLVSEIETS